MKRAVVSLIAAVPAVLTLLATAGCERVTDDMARQPRQDIASTSPFFADREAVRPPPAGSVVHSRGDEALLSSGRAGLVVDSVDSVDSENSRAAASNVPANAGASSIARGHARYLIDCAPCHGERGAGDGEVVRRGFPAPPPLASVALREASDTRMESAIRRGVGVMPALADRVSAADAHAIVAYVRTLQRGANSGALQ